MATMTADLTTPATTDKARLALTVGSILAALGALAYFSVILFESDLSSRESFAAPLNVVGCIAATIGLLLMALALGQGRALGPSWAATVGVLALFFTAANAWFFGTGVLAITSATTDAQFDDMIIDATGIILMAAPKMILGLVGFVSLGIAGWRSNRIPRAAAAFLALGGVASLLPPFPPAVILVSIGMFIVARSRPA